MSRRLKGIVVVAVLVAVSLVLFDIPKRERNDSIEARPNAAPDVQAHEADLISSGKEAVITTALPVVTDSWRASAPSPGSHFAILGSAVPWPPPWDEDATASVQVLHHDGFEWRSGAVATLDESGDFGRIDVQHEAGTRLRLVLAGGDISRAFVEIASGTAGQHATVELPVERGSLFRMAALDGDANRISDSWFRLDWGAGAEMLTIYVQSDWTGVATLHGAPPGRVMTTAGAPGWAAGKFRAIEVPQDVTTIRNWILTPLGRIEGQVLRDGQPVPDFLIHYWTINAPGSHVERSFRDREDGTFVIEDAYAGSMFVTASLSNGVCSQAQLVVASAGEAGVDSITLEVGGGLSGRGKVLSGLNGSPLADATVSAHFADLQVPSAPTGAVTLTNSEGVFLFDGSLRPETILSVDAPDMARAYVRGSLTDQGDVEFGTVTLHPAQTTRVLLQSNGALPVLTYYVNPLNSPEGSMIPLPQSGEIELDWLWPGYHEIELLRGPDSLIVIGRHLIPGQDWEFRFPAIESRSLEFELRGELPQADRSGWWISLHGKDHEGSSFRIQRHVEEGRMGHVSPLPTGKCDVQVVDGDGALLYQTSLVVKPEDGDVHLLGEIGSHQVNALVLDESGAPVPMSTIVFQPDSGALSVIDSTDEGGRTTLLGLDPGPARVTLFHLERGSKSDIPVEILPDADTNLEFVLPSPRPLTLQAMRKGQPVPDLRFELRTTPGDYLVDTRETDAQGVAVFPRCGAGRYYVINLGNEEVWTDWKYVESESSEPHTYEVLYRGDLELEFRTETGEPLTGVEFQLYHEALEYEVMDDLANGLWETSTGGLRPDYSGRVTLHGIAEGPYLIYFSGAARSWKANVMAGETTFEQLDPLPE